MAKQSLYQRASSAIKAATRIVFSGWPNASSAGTGGWRSISDWFSSTYQGTRVNYASAVGDPSLSSLVMAAANWAGRRLPEARLQVVRTDEEDNEKPIPNHALLQLLRRPTGSNNYYSGTRLWQHFAYSWILDGNVYWWLIRNGYGQVIQIWPLFHDLVEPRWSTETSFIDYYEYTPNLTPIKIAPKDIVHFRAGMDDPNNNRKGMSPLRSILREIYTDNERANFAAALMKNSGVPPLVVSFKDAQMGLEKEDIKHLQADVQRRISGDERGKALVVSWPLEVKQLSFDPESLDMRQLGFMSEERFSSVVGINTIVLGFGSGSERSIYNNVESARRSAAEDWLVPTWNVIAEELTAQLLSQPQFQAKENELVKHDFSTVQALQEKENEKHERVRADVTAGILKVKDAQMMLGWPPDENADYYLRPANVVEIQSDGTLRLPLPAAGQGSQPDQSGVDPITP